ncbi:Tetratricopeptide repeat (TPR) superfamily protein [Trifolium repens]|nr:Tetratricopeptide repeat (TPR) superfamily protein [Trifolium repens]
MWLICVCYRCCQFHFVFIVVFSHASSCASSIAAELDLVQHGSDLVQSFYCSLFLADFSPISQQNRLYCFEEGAEQFLLDVAQNTNDIEEFIWCNLCKAQVFGVDEAKLEETEGHSREEHITCLKMVEILKKCTEKVNCIVLTKLKLSLLGSL